MCVYARARVRVDDGRGTRWREGTVPRRYSYGTIAAMSSDQQLAASMQTD